VPFSTVNFRACPASVPPENWNDLNERVLNAVNSTGEVFLSHTKLHDNFVMHLAIGNIRTEERHIARAWELMQVECGKLTAG
jgi:aromatic-L-amino-acid/L-tryptophan decarboxylase